ncbi:NADP-dependent oxidoreductase [Sphingobium sp. 15-1]|uniref:NADP-dependent oxidoreductase n=1 Tax=Sphingobium sp. 15-1 TaxID=2729616 RepID=UPI00159C8C2B|nr:NADP-dependent oxidoreductase [Sphingobium sp. 15-1]
MSLKSRQMHLMSRPNGMPTPENFEMRTVDVGGPGPGEVLVRNRWMSVDPYMRPRMIGMEDSYIPPFSLGEAMDGTAVGEVLESADPAFSRGDLVLSFMGWREAFTAPADQLEKIDCPPGIDEQAFLGVLGMPGLTAYSGLLHLGQPVPGETIFVSGAAGAVGSYVCQIAKIKGLNVVASVGSEEKCAWVLGRGVDHAINYKTVPNLLEAVQAAAPRGIDIYFDNVGAEHLEVALETANQFARFVECGMIATYNDVGRRPGPCNIINIVLKSIRMEGYINSTLAARTPGLKEAFLRDMLQWIAEGRIRWEETVIEGIENALDGFLQLFTGGNVGKMLIRIG